MLTPIEIIALAFIGALVVTAGGFCIADLRRTDRELRAVVAARTSVEVAR